MAPPRIEDPGRKERAPSAAAFLAREERRTLAALQAELAATGEDLCAASGVRAFVRAHPRISLAASAALGAVLAPALAGLARLALPGALGWLRVAAREKAADLERGAPAARRRGS